MHAVPVPRAISAPATPSEVRQAAAVLWSGGTSYRVTDPRSGRSVRLDVASLGGKTRLRLTTPDLVIWLGSNSTATAPTFVCVRVPPGKTTCDPSPKIKSTAEATILEATRPLLVYSSLISKGALAAPTVLTTHEAGYPVGCIEGYSTAGLGAVRLCTTRDGLLTEVAYKGIRVQALSVDPAITTADVERPA